MQGNRIKIFSSRFPSYRAYWQKSHAVPNPIKVI